MTSSLVLVIQDDVINGFYQNIWHALALEKENGSPLQCSCLENPRDGGLPSMGSHRVRHN